MGGFDWMAAERRHHVTQSRFLRACRLEEVDRTPVWFMRQAGRYMSEYQELRKSHTLLEICRRPELAAEVTFQPIRRFDLDAAIIFADILLPLPELGVDFEFLKGEGPVVHRPIRTPEQVEKLLEFDPADNLGFVLEAIRRVRAELAPEIALIGFAGAPFTLASYMIEGGASRHFMHAKTFMYKYPTAWRRLMETLSLVTLRYLEAQAEAGADALQLFDSWVGCLSPEDYRTYVLPYSRFIFEGLKDLSLPTIHFGTDTSSLLELLKEAGGSVIGLDWRVELRDAWNRLGDDVAVQGNLDPVALLAPRPALLAKVEGILDQAAGQVGHIFNLGHGILPQTPVENVEAVVELVHGMSSRPVSHAALDPNSV